MAPRLVDPAPAADVPLATESLSERAEAVAAERDVRAGVGLAEGKGRGRAGAADSGEGDDVGSGAGAAGVDLRLEKEPDEWGRWGGGLGTRNGGFSVILSRGDSIEDRVVSLGGPSTAAGGEPMPPSAAVARESARAGHMGSEAVRPAPSALSSLSSSSSSASSACSSPPRLWRLALLGGWVLFPAARANPPHLHPSLPAFLPLQFFLTPVSIRLPFPHFSPTLPPPATRCPSRTLQRGALTERVLQVFRATKHPLVEEAVVLLGLTHHSPAPILPTRTLLAANVPITVSLPAPCTLSASRLSCCGAAVPHLPLPCGHPPH
ncbi:unnamed protein product [Closterium sp. Naga37s-1]|nr:unnamed protein product [Closterium sp. Naga37s-1]